MTKKQPKSDATRRRNRVDSSTRQPKPPKSDPNNFHGSNNHHFLAIIAVVFVVSSAISAFLYRRINHPSLPPSFAHQRGLVKEDVTFQEILTENSRVSENVTQRHFTNPVLAYITPWNSAGYDLAKRFCPKFTHLSPVWYDLKSQGTKLVLEGRHNADTGWMSELRLRGNAQILPRVVLEAVPKDLLRSKKQRDKAIDLLITECKDIGYDGIVLESWSRWAAHGVLHDASLRKLALQFVKQLGDSLHNVRSQRNGQPLQLVYVIGPPYSESEKLQAHDFGPEDLRTLSDSVDGFSLMTYDYSSSYSPGPNAPLTWVHSTIKLLVGEGGKSLANKIFVGINFYGNDYVVAEGGGARAITGRDYLSLVDQYKPTMRWQKDFAEHFFVYSDDQHHEHAVFYPTLMSIAERLKEARSWGAGISIWEIGQGLDYFFDLL
ncbi:chitinase domain-containing protein 1-like [Chenopodium quinoa]|uniref:Chitinase domain-containing protein 1 n=1 Tax=Chenopodium quinoa TaxID=63459 RepID=A0A803M4V8_CHEQI|nr:chitinase domain-containing protein 1-like [Chenopodium quinoa]